MGLTKEGYSQDPRITSFQLGSTMLAAHVLTPTTPTGVENAVGVGRQLNASTTAEDEYRPTRHQRGRLAGKRRESSLPRTCLFISAVANFNEGANRGALVRAYSVWRGDSVPPHLLFRSPFAIPEP